MLTKAYPVAALVMLAVGLAAPAGCGSGSSDAGELAGALPGDPQFVSYLDIAAAREALELPDDADPADYSQIEDPDDPPPESQLVTAAGNVLPHVKEPQVVTFDDDATSAAIDHSQVTAAAASIDPEGRAAILETDQSFDEIAEALEGSGFELDGDVYAGETAEPEPAFPYVADLGDGRIVVAAELEDAEAALAGEDEASAAATLLGELEAPQREAVTPGDESCVTGFAIGGEPGGSEVEIVFTVDGEPDLDLVTSELELSPVTEAELGEPEIDGETVHVTMTLGGDAPTDPSALFAAGAILPADLYDCG